MAEITFETNSTSEYLCIMNKLCEKIIHLSPEPRFSKQIPYFKFQNTF